MSHSDKNNPTSKNTLVLASSNQGKIKEFSTLLQPLGLRVAPQSDFNVPDIEETGLSFIENALLKARNASKITQLPAIADDSGLVVPALGGQPGIFSARYAGTRSDADNIQLLLKNMQDLPKNNRQAHFICALVCVRHAQDPDPIIAIERWHGEVLTTPKGEQGFGYDPIFWVASEQATAAELPPEKKRHLSHRGQATRALIKKIRSLSIVS